ncbi:MAG: hypothetical protein Q9202_005537 [Teloschistes flavicans]
MQLLWLLTLATAVSANPFWFRQEDSDPGPATSASSSEESEPTASPSSIASPAEPTAVNGTAPTANSTNGTASATSTSTAAATDSAALPEDPDTTAKCHIDHEDKPTEDVMPFCEPKQGQYVYVGQTYAVTWDPTLFTPNATNQIELKHENDTNGTMIWSQSGVVNELAHVSLKMHEDFLQSPNRTNLTLFIHSVAPDNDDDPTANQPVTKSGPVFTLITNATLVSQEKAKSGAKQMGEKAGIPVGLGVFLVALAGALFWFLRRRRNRKEGYMAKRSRTRRMTGDEGAGGFRDEPTRGMELQDRGGGGVRREDSWEAGWETGSSQGGGGGGNAFRDEVERQRRR